MPLLRFVAVSVVVTLTAALLTPMAARAATPIKYVRPPGTESFATLSNHVGTCLDLENDTGPAILHYPCNGTVAQEWVLHQYSNEYWDIRPLHHQSDCASVDDAGRGTYVVRWPCQGPNDASRSQLWEIWTYDYSYFWFSPGSNRGTCLDAQGFSPWKYALAWGCNGSNNQHWRIENQP